MQSTIEPMTMERRQCARVLLGCPVMMKSTKGILVGQIIDISASGAFICCKEPLEIEEGLEMHFRASPTSPTLVVLGKVVRSKVHCLDGQANCHGMGIHFTKMSGQGRTIITDIVEKGSRV